VFCFFWVVFSFCILCIFVFCPVFFRANVNGTPTTPLGTPTVPALLVELTLRLISPAFSTLPSTKNKSNVIMAHILQFPFKNTCMSFDDFREANRMFMSIDTTHHQYSAKKMNLWWDHHYTNPLKHRSYLCRHSCNYMRTAAEKLEFPKTDSILQ